MIKLNKINKISKHGKYVLNIAGTDTRNQLEERMKSPIKVK